MSDFDQKSFNPRWSKLVKFQRFDLGTEKIFGGSTLALAGTVHAFQD